MAVCSGHRADGRRGPVLATTPSPGPRDVATATRLRASSSSRQFPSPGASNESDLRWTGRGGQIVHRAPRRGHRRPPRRPRLAARAVSTVGVHVSDSGAARPEPSTTPRNGSSSGMPSRVVLVATPTASSSWREAPVVRSHHLCAALRFGLAVERTYATARA